MAKKVANKKEDKNLNLDAILFNCRDYLRSEILFMDLRTWTENLVKGERKKKVELKADQVARAAEIYFRWQQVGTEGFCGGKIQLEKAGK